MRDVQRLSHILKVDFRIAFDERRAIQTMFEAPTKVLVEIVPGHSVFVDLEFRRAALCALMNPNHKRGIGTFDFNINLRRHRNLGAFAKMMRHDQKDNQQDQQDINQRSDIDP